MMAVANMPVEVNHSPVAMAAHRRVPSSATRLLVPREHGSWGLWLLPLISGAVVGWSTRSLDSAAAIAWFILAAGSAFLVHQPLQAWLGRAALKAHSTEEKRIALAATLVFLALSGLSLIALSLLGRSLMLVLAVFTGACFAANVLMEATKTRSLRAAAQTVGALGLTSTAAGAYYAVAGTIGSRAVLLWLASWLFAATQIAYVQLRLRTASARSRAEKFRAGWKVCLLHLALPLIAAVAAMSGTVSWLLALAFVPAAVRFVLWAFSSPTRIRVHRLGFIELAHNLVFAALLVVALLPLR